MAARAIENVADIVCINQTGTREMTKLHGGSKVIDCALQPIRLRIRCSLTDGSKCLCGAAQRDLQALNEAVTNSLSGTLIP